MDEGLRIRDIVKLDIRVACLPAPDIETGIDAMITGRKDSPFLYMARGNNMGNNRESSLGVVHAPIFIGERIC